MKKTILSLFVILCASRLVAAISEPDNIIYGRIVIDGALVTAADTTVTVSAVGSSGEIYSTYAMGEDPSTGDFYRLIIPVEAFGPTTVSNVSVIGSSVRVVVKKSSVEVRDYDVTITDRGVVARIDLGGVDDDHDGVPDAWELEHFGNLSTVSATSDFDNDGMIDRDELIAGSDPDDPLSLFRIDDVKSLDDGWCRINWKSAAGRTYKIMTSTNLLSGAWQPMVDGVMATPPANTYEINAGKDAIFFRVYVRDSMTNP